MVTDAPEQLRALAGRAARRGQVIQYILSSLLLIFLVWGLYAWRISSQQPKVESIDISNIAIDGPTVLCPGDTLRITYDVAIDGVGVVIWDASTIREGEPVTYSTARRFIVEGPTRLSMEDEWRVPLRSDSEPWVPGVYRRYLAISPQSNYPNRFTPPAIFEVPFEIKQNCGG